MYVVQKVGYKFKANSFEFFVGKSAFKNAAFRVKWANGSCNLNQNTMHELDAVWRIAYVF